MTSAICAAASSSWRSGEKVLVDLPETDRARRMATCWCWTTAARPRSSPRRKSSTTSGRATRVHLAELAWHIGNRHLAAAIEPDRILILRDHVIKAMLEGLGATVADTVEPFEPLPAPIPAMARTATAITTMRTSDHHGHGERDAFGRLPGDPHYGHSHG